jgi:hypothetical protein
MSIKDLAKNTLIGKSITREANYKQTHNYIALVLFTICVGAFLRLYSFWSPPIWVDEYGTWWVVAADDALGVIDRTLRIQGQSPLYYLTVKAITSLGGYQSFQLRLPSIVFGILTLVVIYPLALKIFDDQRIALLYLVVVATSEPFIWYSQIARPYSLALFFTLLSFWSFVSLQDTNTIATRLCFVLSTALTIYAHYLFGLIVIIQAMYLLLTRGCGRLFSKFWLINFSAIAIVLVPASGQLIDLFHRRHVLDWMESVDASWKLASVIIYMIGAAPPSAILAAAVTVAIIGFDRQQLQCAAVRAKLCLPILWYTIPVVAFLVIPSLIGVTLIQPRYLLFAFPATYMLFTWLTFTTRAFGYRKWLPPVLFVTTTALFVWPSGLNHTQTFARWPGHGWNDALGDLFRHYKSEGIIVAQLGLIEADLLTVTDEDPEFLSYLTWPLISSLPELEQDDIAILPYSLTARTQGYLLSLLDRVAKHHTIWLVGGGEALWSFQDHLVQRSGYRIASRRDYPGAFHLFMLVRNSE